MQSMVPFLLVFGQKVILALKIDSRGIDILECFGNYRKQVPLGTCMEAGAPGPPLTPHVDLSPYLPISFESPGIPTPGPSGR